MSEKNHGFDSDAAVTVANSFVIKPPVPNCCGSLSTITLVLKNRQSQQNSAKANQRRLQDKSMPQSPAPGCFASPESDHRLRHAQEALSSSYQGLIVPGRHVDEPEHSRSGPKSGK